MIKKVEEKDIQTVLEVSQEQFEEESWNLSQFTSSFFEPNTIIWGNFKEDILAGFLVVQILVDEVNILLIATKENFKNQNIASELIEYLINYSKKNNYKKIWLEVKEDNIPAQKLYYKFNFNLINIRNNYYKNNKNALILQKIIEN